MTEALLAEGHQVLVIDKDATRIDEINERDVHGCQLAGMCVDLSTPSAVQLIEFTIKDMWNGVDILVNNAGLGPNAIAKDYFEKPPSFVDLDDEVVRRFFMVNAITPFLLAVRCARFMRDQKWGRIVNVTTSHDSMTRRGFAPYGGTKASLEAHTSIMANDLQFSNVTANVLIPGGPADTAMIPAEAGFDRSQLVRPEDLGAPLRWLIRDVENPPNGKRVLASQFKVHGGPTEASVFPVGWEGPQMRASMPAY
jgi:3-oxoacyl-[acyl-carrier protein] reductase